MDGVCNIRNNVNKKIEKKRVFTPPLGFLVWNHKIMTHVRMSIIIDSYERKVKIYEV